MPVQFLSNYAHFIVCNCIVMVKRRLHLINICMCTVYHYYEFYRVDFTLNECTLYENLSILISYKLKHCIHV